MSDYLQLSVNELSEDELDAIAGGANNPPAQNGGNNPQGPQDIFGQLTGAAVAINGQNTLTTLNAQNSTVKLGALQVLGGILAQ